ncbi:Glucosamine 6-phosphate N-acetyltransferase [Rhynchospora pubera]|uniref:Glucosamine 6-phosphate N-acetyltransferase n=1 Tax=Rhynchospora pubera TaxID=906938 RepID=A0AAV8HKW7_9POAL|nr:Glucosamine 6-phosphate N-acetyltransferase [Rhynchospora pubera]
MSDYDKGFVRLLCQLTLCPSLSKPQFQACFADLATLGDNHYVGVIEDPISGCILASGSVLIERKFIRGGGKVGHIEDVVVDKAARRIQLGQRIVDHLVHYAKTVGCYKVILDCKPDLREFYKKCGFVESNVQMALYF